jgi:hypothetical protein
VISLVTTAVNRPEILRDMLDTLRHNSDVWALDVEWVVHVDCVEQLPDAEARFERTLALCGEMKGHFPVSLSSRRPARGPAAAIEAMRPRIRGQTVLFVEDDWWCHPELATRERLSVRSEVERMRERDHAYRTLAGQTNIPSFSPGLIRTDAFLALTEDLDPRIDAEVQFIRRWHTAQKADPTRWRIAPGAPRYFQDLGRAWQRANGLVKWPRPERLVGPTTYGVTEADPTVEKDTDRTVPEFAPPDS